MVSVRMKVKVQVNVRVRVRVSDSVRITSGGRVKGKCKDRN
jgi:hypothetical protein